MSNKMRGIFNYDYLNKEIKDFFKYYDLQLEDLAISIGMTERTLKRTLNNERCFYLNEMYRLIDTLKIKEENINKAFFNIIDEDELLKGTTSLINYQEREEFFNTIKRAKQIKDDKEGVINE